MLQLKDSRGKQSKTLGFITIAFVVMNAAFIYSVFKLNTVDIMAYGTAIMTILAPWIGREAFDKGKSDVQ